jgi:hypothetical protein
MSNSFRGSFREVPAANVIKASSHKHTGKLIGAATGAGCGKLCRLPLLSRGRRVGRGELLWARSGLDLCGTKVRTYTLLNIHTAVNWTAVRTGKKTPGGAGSRVCTGRRRGMCVNWALGSVVIRCLIPDKEIKELRSSKEVEDSHTRFTMRFTRV